MPKTYNENTVKFLRSWGKGNKVIKQYGGSNFWGPNPKRCSVLRPEMLAELQHDGIIQMLPLGNSFIVLKEKVS